MPPTPPRPDKSEEARRSLSAYPSNITYLDLIRRNKIESAALMVAMVVLAVFIGGMLATLVMVYAGTAESVEQLAPSIALGCAAALIMAVLGCVWSWYGGASAILAMTGAKEIRKEDDPELFNVVEEMAIAAGLPMPRVFIINDRALNAFATGRDPKHGIIGVTQGLRRRLSRDELQAVVAHEMAHIRHYDIRFAMLMATMVGLIVFAADVLTRVVFHGGRAARVGGRGGGRGGGKGGGAAMLVIFALMILLMIVSPILARFIQMAYSRRREYLADAGAVELTRNPQALASALSSLAVDPHPMVDRAHRSTAHMFIVNPLRGMRESKQQLNSIFASHPPIQQRIARILALLR